MNIYKALDLQMPTNMKYENMKMKAQNEYEMDTEYISEYLNINTSKMNEWIMYKTATEKYDILNIASQTASMKMKMNMNIIKRAKMKYVHTMKIWAIMMMKYMAV